LLVGWWVVEAGNKTLNIIKSRFLKPPTTPLRYCIIPPPPFYLTEIGSKHVDERGGGPGAGSALPLLSPIVVVVVVVV